MKLKLVTVAFDPDEGRFPEDPLSGLDGEAISVVEHFFTHGGRPHLLLVVHYEPALEPPARRRRQDEATLAPHERPLFARLRAWRNGRAEAEGVPPYTLLTNRQLVDVVRRRPGNPAELERIHGIGSKKVERFGADLVALLKADGGDGGGP